MKDDKGMTIIVKKITQIIVSLIFIYGIYIITHGHISPGGGFSGSVIIAGAFILLVIAFGKNILGLKSEEGKAGFFETIGILLFILTASGAIILGAILGTNSTVFFKNFLAKGVPGELFSARFIFLLNIFIGLEVAGALITIFLAFVIKSEEGKTT